jgi:hypothetical protein
MVQEPPITSEELLAKRRAADPLGPAVMPASRDNTKAWPPQAAGEHDGIKGDILRRLYPPAGDPIPKIKALAQEGLREIDRFREANPEAAASIAEPLAEYRRRLMEARDHPETRLLKEGLE